MRGSKVREVYFTSRDGSIDAMKSAEIDFI